MVNFRSASIVTSCSSSRPVLPYVTHHSDSGFSSALSTGSCCSFYLPPPPPYKERSPFRQRSGTIGSEGGNQDTGAMTSSIPGYQSGTLGNNAASSMRQAHQHRIHRSLSDSKYGTTGLNGTSTTSLSPSTALPQFLSVKSPSAVLQNATSDTRVNRGSSWSMSVVSSGNVSTTHWARVYAFRAL